MYIFTDGYQASQFVGETKGPTSILCDVRATNWRDTNAIKGVFVVDGTRRMDGSGNWAHRVGALPGERGGVPMKHVPVYTVVPCGAEELKGEEAVR